VSTLPAPNPHGRPHSDVVRPWLNGRAPPIATLTSSSSTSASAPVPTHSLDYIRRSGRQHWAEGTQEHYRHWHDFAQRRLFGLGL
jgi:hypothetical protein